ncbi:hypothetical protein GA0116948_11085 [Chitinophaga costaii]|uniref:Uncharacterized protein n=1 Tax=Chitinophaga costaii TaxID=1335309 RepID=A0A1C4EXH1_9BACT|nr:hypothetical protein [Chitinophaga costaii]PUZ21576.1 hypothetical protein DCM91_16200 [Chitinophaga costaii]SCC48211.1 hypothetical protein GA0116948_11085 [Chitinophaga costaii]
MITYQPAFFQVKIPTHRSLKNLKELPPLEQGLYFHEYLHFLQNLTTLYGASVTWNTYDRIRQVIREVQQASGEIVLPLNGAAVELETAHFNIIKKLTGSKDINDISSVMAEYVLQKITFPQDPLIETAFPTAGLTLIQLHFSHPQQPDITYNFGQTAISESMAYLAERKFFNLNNTSDFPYKVAEKVAIFLYPAFATNSEWLFALCDSALLHPHPGWAYVSILTAMTTEHFIPNNAEGVIDYSLKFYANNDWNIEKQLEYSVTAVLNIIDDIYQHEFFKMTKQWLKAIITNGEKIRVLNPYCMLPIFRDTEGLGNGLGFFINHLGGPHCINGLNERFMILPNGFSSSESAIHPQHLLALWQVHDLLLAGSVPCKLYDICQTDINSIVDNRCKISPWTRSTDEWGCPFVAIWVTLGLNTKRYIKNGIPVILG